MTIFKINYLKKKKKRGDHIGRVDRHEKYIKCDQQQHAKLLAPFYSFNNCLFNRTKSHFAEDVSAVTKKKHAYFHILTVTRN